MNTIIETIIRLIRLNIIQNKKYIYYIIRYKYSAYVYQIFKFEILATFFLAETPQLQINIIQLYVYDYVMISV